MSYSYDPNLESYEALGGLVLLLDNAATEQAGLLPGALYEFYCFGGTALCRWDTTAAASADAGFTFFVGEGETKRVRNPTGNTLLNIIELDTSSEATATLILTRVLPE